MLLVVLVLVAGIWALAFSATRAMERQLTQYFGDTLSTRVADVADDLDRDVRLHLDALQRLAAALQPDILTDPNRRNKIFDRFAQFSAVAANTYLVTNKTGDVVARYPAQGTEVGESVADRDFFRQAVASGNPAIGAILRPPELQAGPAVPFAIPLREGSGSISGVLIGVVLLAESTMLGQLRRLEFEDQSRFLVISPPDRLILSAPDPSQTLQRMPAKGINPQLDRRLDEGYERPEITLTASDGPWLEVGKKMATTGWMVLTGVPTEHLFAPIEDLKNRIYLAALLISLLAAAVVHTVLARKLALLAAAARAMQRMTDGEIPLAPLAVARTDEIGQLLRNFNRLVAERSRLEESLRSEVAERRQANEALRESRDRLDGVYRSVGDGIVSADENMRLVLFNAAAEKIFGRSAASVIGQPLGILLPQRYRDGHEKYLRTFAASGNANRAIGSYGRIHGLRASGEEFPMEAKVSQSGMPPHTLFTVILRDITERRHAELVRERLMRQLELLSERLVVAHEEERRKIAYELHEELGQELTTLRYCIQMIGAGNVDMRSEAPREDALSMAMHAIERVRRLVLDVEPRELENLGLYAAMRSYAERQAGAAQWLLQIDAPRPEVRAPREVERACFRVFREVLGNVLQHARATRVWIELRQSATELAFRVRDDGIGFNAASTQGDVTREGGNLGLFAIRMLVKHFSGSIEIKSAPGAGAEIRAVLPLTGSLGLFDSLPEVPRITTADSG